MGQKPNAGKRGQARSVRQRHCQSWRPGCPHSPRPGSAALGRGMTVRVKAGQCPELPGPELAGACLGSGWGPSRHVRKVRERRRIGGGGALQTALPGNLSSGTEGSRGGWWAPSRSLFHALPGETLPSPDPSTGWAGTLTPGHLDELGDTEHAGGDETLLEVGGVWNREKRGLSGSVSFLDTLGYPDSGGWSGHPVRPRQPRGKMEAEAGPGFESQLGCHFVYDLGQVPSRASPLCSLICKTGATRPPRGGRDRNQLAGRAGLLSVSLTLHAILLRLIPPPPDREPCADGGVCVPRSRGVPSA